MHFKYLSIVSLAAMAAADPATDAFNSFNEAVQGIRKVIDNWDGSIDGLTPIIGQAGKIATGIKNAAPIAYSSSSQDDNTVNRRLLAAKNLHQELNRGLDSANTKKDKLDNLPFFSKPAFATAGKGVSVAFELLKGKVLSQTPEDNKADFMEALNAISEDIASGTNIFSP